VTRLGKLKKEDLYLGKDRADFNEKQLEIEKNRAETYKQKLIELGCSC